MFTPAARVTDEALMRAVREGDLAKLGVLFERHHRALFDFLSRVTGDRTEAEDLVQDVFVRMLKYRATYRDDGRFETWMFHLARHAGADDLRVRGAVQHVDVDAARHLAQDDGIEGGVQRERDVERVRRALMTLSEDKRELIVLARYRELKHEQIADILGITVGAVKVRLHRALRALRGAFFQTANEGSSCDVKTSTPKLRSISTER